MAPMSSFVFSRRLLYSLAVPSTAICLAAYFYNHPLPASRSRNIRETDALSPSTLVSPAIKLINPRNNQALVNTITIALSETDVEGLSDEEILARFTKGFFNGWIIFPERLVMGFFELFGSAVIPVSFTGIKRETTTIPVFAKLSLSSPPPKHTPFFGGNFMVIGNHLRPKDQGALENFVEVGFGDDRKSFAGMHRFEVSKRAAGQGVVVGYSCCACNPKDDTPIYPWINRKFVAKFHGLYALLLFRDGIREVLGGRS